MKLKPSLSIISLHLVVEAQMLLFIYLVRGIFSPLIGFAMSGLGVFVAAEKKPLSDNQEDRMNEIYFLLSSRKYGWSVRRRGTQCNGLWDIFHFGGWPQHHAEAGCTIYFVCIQMRYARMTDGLPFWLGPGLELVLLWFFLLCTTDFLFAAVFHRQQVKFVGFTCSTHWSLRPKWPANANASRIL